MCEIVLVGMESSDSMRFLNDPNICIGDTSVSVLASPYKHETIPEDKSKHHGSITVGNGISEKTAMYGDIAGIHKIMQCKQLSTSLWPVAQSVQ
jgi:hypothetical protein